MFSVQKVFWACTLAAVLCYCTKISALRISDRISGTGTLFSKENPRGQRCAPTSDIPTAHANLTAEELDLLEYICLDSDSIVNIARSSITSTPRLEDQQQQIFKARSGIPPGTSCQPTSWCDSGQCTEVCTRGTVAVEPWLSNAVRLQARLARTLPFCFSCFFGTHNSAISLADGYGNLDPSYQALFKYVKWASADFSHSVLRTNNQWLSLTDQLNLGVRVLEIDTHWVGGVLRVAHCGGLHVQALNSLVKALNTVAKILGHHIRWDTETMGCDPSLSSIPSMLQRTLKDALQEIKAWMDVPENQDELVVLFFDDQPNLGQWGVAHKLQEDILSVFIRELIFTQDDLAENGWQWPTGAEMVMSGRKLVLVSIADYGQDMAPIVFPRDTGICSWTEPSLQSVSAAPECVLNGVTELFTGSLVRVSTCELEYGPLNCEFVWKGGNIPYFDEASIPGVVDCGVNIPSPDLLTPSRAAAAVWTWAPGHPFSSSSNANMHSINGGGGGGGGDARAAECAIISASDGRWRSAPCSTVSTTTNSTLPAVCRVAGTPIESDNQWIVGPPTTNPLLSSSLSSGTRTSNSLSICPEGSSFDVPRHPRENFWLAAMLRQQGIDAAWLPIQGPDWSVDGIPAYKSSVSSEDEAGMEVQ
ncbi:hypothetical protein Ndes2526B_g02453 [Nannochloris sp. 'desiccata']|nr:hypothetical protein KSW81_007238 [Chlorella desiccata (nom. nud.)]KAH7621641.1 hypothetical protein NADE_004246 [Chlorella desiccata (nom. nud.)]